MNKKVSKQEKLEMLLQYRVNRYAIHAYSTRGNFISTKPCLKIDKALRRLVFQATGVQLKTLSDVQEYIAHEHYYQTTGSYTSTDCSRF